MPYKIQGGVFRRYRGRVYARHSHSGHDEPIFTLRAAGDDRWRTPHSAALTSTGLWTSRLIPSYASGFFQGVPRHVRGNKGEIARATLKLAMEPVQAAFLAIIVFQGA